MFSVLIFLTVFAQILEQILPVFVSQRTLYEARERPSKVYSWKAFMLANILIEMTWNSVRDNTLIEEYYATHSLTIWQLMAVLSFVCWYFPIGLYRNAYATNAVDSRGITMFLHVWAFFLFTSTFASMMIAGFEHPDSASAVANLLFVMMFAFCG